GRCVPPERQHREHERRGGVVLEGRAVPEGRLPEPLPARLGARPHGRPRAPGRDRGSPIPVRLRLGVSFDPAGDASPDLRTDVVKGGRAMDRTFITAAIATVLCATSVEALTTDALLDSLQHTAFDYFWNEANPANGLVKDR